MYLKRKINLIKQIKNLNCKKEFKHYLEGHFDLHKRNENFKIKSKSLIEEKKLQQIEISAKIQRYSDLCNQNKSNKLNDKINITTPQFEALKSNLDEIKNLKSFLNSLKKENDTKYRTILHLLEQRNNLMEINNKVLKENANKQIKIVKTKQKIEESTSTIKNRSLGLNLLQEKVSFDLNEISGKKEKLSSILSSFNEIEYLQTKYI